MTRQETLDVPVTRPKSFKRPRSVIGEGAKRDRTVLTVLLSICSTPLTKSQNLVGHPITPSSSVTLWVYRKSMESSLMMSNWL